MVDDRASTYRWKFTSNGEYTVKFAYEVIEGQCLNSSTFVGEQSNRSQAQSFWRKIWSARVPNKVKMFCWRLFYNSLPDALNLERRGIAVDRRCKICGFQMESAIHVVRDCWWAKGVAAYLGLETALYAPDSGSPADWVWWCAARLPTAELRLFLMAIWLCWKNRNQVWHDKESWGTERAAMIGRSILRLSETFYCPNPMENADLSGRWRPPEGDVVKVNSDGSWGASSRMAGVSSIARDCHSVVLWTWADFLEFCSCPSEGEGHALLRSMELAHHFNIRKVIFEVDYLDVYKAVVIGVGLAAWSDSWIGTVLDMLSVKPGWRVLFASRDSNTVADFLAHKARAQRWRWNRLNATPFCLSCAC
ncbi:hypothetical protein QQ045_006176 [Rhodiola kirilowii]